MHRVKIRFGVNQLMAELYESKDWPNWSQNYDTIHLLTNHRYYLDSHFKEYEDFNEQNIQHYPYMFGKLVRLVVPADRLLAPSLVTNRVRSKYITSLSNTNPEILF
jgi:hypothetical protein